ncbi:Mfa1 family fimbria major subunit [Parabacteroides sp. PF5-6]|uniref:Mfa1 family fimbria major subunit n=1 Tax=Parabacteroides sp. PF5-6 TaxID=1742403 RepID=UPI0024057E7C|nr:Mfa1 family fimbria major subunit [Parabacteroides sp. PF5-6]MDF9830790.1 hypothetical protein [Parabacteroides sp. PF5-6]
MKHKLIHRVSQLLENVWIHVLMLSLLTLGACTNDSILTTPDPVIPATTDTAYLALAIDFKSYLITKGYEGESSAGESEEDYVKKVRLVLYDGELATSKVVKAFSFNIETDNSSSGQAWKDNSEDKRDLANTVDQKDKWHFITYARKVPLMDYKMLVIVNPNDYLEQHTREGDTYNQVSAAHKLEEGEGKSVNVSGLAKANYFLMTSGPGLIDVPADELSATVRAAHNSPFRATVGRVVGKVTLAPPVGETTIPTATSGAEVSNVRWELDITNRYTFWIKRFSSTDRENEYGEDPNYTGFKKTNNFVLEDNFIYVINSGGLMPVLNNALNGSEYCLENTMDLTDQTEKNVITRALISCTYKPANVETAGEGFYVYDNSTFSFREMNEFAKKAENTPAGSRPALSEAILRAKSSGYTFIGGRPYHNDELCNESFSGVAGITYYHNGINYYAVKILHLGDSDDAALVHGHYGVLRNTHYTIHINKIEGPGSPYIFPHLTMVRSGFPEEDMPDLYKNIETGINIR